MASYIANNTDDIAEALGIDLSGYQDKSAGLIANIAMDIVYGRLIRSPINAVADLVAEAEKKGSPVPIDEQDAMAAKALSIDPFWNGYRSARTWTVFWSMLCWNKRPVYHSQAWHERMREIDGAVQASGVCQAAYERVTAAAEAVEEADAYGGDQETFDAFVAYLIARETFYVMHDAVVRDMGVDPDKVDVQTTYTWKANELDDACGPASYSTYVREDGELMIRLRNHAYTKAAISKARREALTNGDDDGSVVPQQGRDSCQKCRDM